MKGDRKMKHVCRLCSKRFPCGRSLGGHMRSHMIGNSSEAEGKAKPHRKIVSSSNGGRNSNREPGFEVGEHSGYGLRENPKKTWRAGDSSFDLRQENVCKECGKEFQSLKALNGHMSSHSGTKRVSNNSKDYLWTGAKQETVMDGQSDSKADALRPRTRTKRRKYNTLAASSASFCLANGSSPVSDIEQEKEDVALCLMMLSRDFGRWDGVNLAAEYSDNNSVVLEDKSLSNDKTITIEEGLNCVCEGEMKKKEAVIVLSENSDSGCFRNGAKKAESEVSVDEVFRNDEFENPKVEDIPIYGVNNANLGKGLSRLQCIETELKKQWIYEEKCDQANRALVKNDSRETAKDDSCNSELWGNCCKIMAHGSSNVKVQQNAQKKSKYACLTCNETFNSQQALGGHRSSHKWINCCFALRYDSGKNNRKSDKFSDLILDSKFTDRDLSGNAEKQFRSKEGKRHKCPICLKVFPSGQALGGHMRLHSIGGEEDKSNHTVIKQELPEISQLLDLNLPAPIDEEENSQAEFMPW